MSRFRRRRSTRPSSTTRKSSPKRSQNSRPKCAPPRKNSSLSAPPSCATKRESCARKCCKIHHMSRILALLLFFNANVFGQAAAGNEKYDQKQYADAVNAYEKIPSAERNAGILNRLGISYHLLKQFKAAENAYKAAISKDLKNTDAPNNLAAL